MTTKTMRQRYFWPDLPREIREELLKRAINIEGNVQEAMRKIEYHNAAMGYNTILAWKRFIDNIKGVL